MRISNVTTIKQAGKVRLQATVSFEKEKKPHQVYFEVEKKNNSHLLPDATPFLAAFLIPAMAKNEPIVIEGSTVSEKFLQNMPMLMRKLHRWNKEFSLISIAGDTKPDRAKKSLSAEFFTAGVDSFYTYLKARKNRNNISHFLFVHGFDIDLENREFFKSVKTGIEKIAHEENITLIPLKTNCKKIIEQYVEWDWGHGGALAAISLLLRNKVTTAYIAGALRRDQLFPYGTHPDIDPLWGTESLSIIHDGNEYDRLDKVINVVGKSNLALKHLRVCNQNLKGRYNCSKCFKCLWTMMTLECAGMLDKSHTFDREIDLEAVKKMRYTFERNYHLAGVRVINELKKQRKRKDLQDAVRESLKRSREQTLIQKVSQKVAELDKKYNNRRLFLAIFAVTKNQDRTPLFKLLARQGIIK